MYVGKKLIIGLHTNQLSERGTEVALFDYANHNEKILNNISYIFYNKKNNNNPCVLELFGSRFGERCIAYNDFAEIESYCGALNIDVMYIIKSGENDGKLVKCCKNLIHVVFNATQPHGDKYTVISPFLNQKYNTNHECIPHMIDMPECNEDLRKSLNIPENAIVLGRYGGYDQFDISFVKKTIINFLDQQSKRSTSNDTEVYFLFANTRPFIQDHQNVVYIDTIYDRYEKAKFIRTCDAMIHGRSDGETFGLSIAEFNFYNKPIITTPSGRDNAHMYFLGDKGIYYKTEGELMQILENIKMTIGSRDDWRAFDEYTPQNVMRSFKRCLDELIKM